jgi:hypothetical protein
MLYNNFGSAKGVLDKLVYYAIAVAENGTIMNFSKIEDLKSANDVSKIDAKNHDCCPISEKNSSGQKNVNTINSNYQKADSCINSEVDIPPISEEKESLNHSIPQKVEDKTQTNDEIDLNHSTGQKEMKDIQENPD